MIDKIINTVICGDAREKLKELPAGAVSCIITSPPYWALRDYGIEPMIWNGKMGCEHKWKVAKGLSSRRKSEAEVQANTERAKERGYDKKQWGDDRFAIDDSQFCSLCGAWRGCLGLEPTIELYLKHLVGIFDEAKRVLRDDGVCFVNLGDTYWGGKGQSGQGSPEYQEARQDLSINRPASHIGGQKLTRPQDMQHDTIQAKSLCLIPFRFAIEMVNHGWILRNTIIWSKPNPMPSSAKDRFTVDFEYIFFFVKKKKYWFEPQYEEYVLPMNRWGGEELKIPMVSCPVCYGKNSRTVPNGVSCGYCKNVGRVEKKSIRDVDTGQDTYRNRNMRPNPLGRNKRTTWTIPTESFPEAHFATFPCALVEPMIKCGCPEFVCKKCGKARVKVYETKDIKRPRPNPKTEPCAERGQSPNDYGGKEITNWHYTSCSCNAGYKPGIVMDFFSGSGTVGKVAAYLRRNYILIDAKKDYCKMAEERIAEPETGVPVKEQRIGQQGLFE